MRQEKTKDRPFKKFAQIEKTSVQLKKSIEQLPLSGGGNNIVTFGLRTQSRLLGRIDRQMQELQGLAQQFEEVKTAKDAIDAIKETGKLFDEVKGKFSELQGAKLDRDRRKLERTYKGLVDRLTAKAAALNKRVFELSNPRKLVKMPKGSTQIDFVNAIDKLTLGDRKAIKEFTVPRPAKAKKPAKRKK